MEAALKILKEYWGFDDFRAIQKLVVAQVLERKDVFAMLPTGGGKSLCFQVSGLVFKGVCIVVSPLIALMEDQVINLSLKGIPAAFIYAGMTEKEIIDVLYKCVNGELKFLYVSPERILTVLFQEYFVQMNVNLIAVDEAHCISQWGHDFRPAFRAISILRNLQPNVPFLALTASATKLVQEDIIQQLKLKNPKIFEQSIARMNLSYHIKYSERKIEDAIKGFQKTKGSGILYCRSRRKTMDTALNLKNLGSINAIYYHAGLTKEERSYAQKTWLKSNDAIMCATTAFGMGIDKPDVRLVIHYDLPEDLESYYQEAGRAGRDGMKAFGVTLFNGADIEKLKKLPEINFPPIPYILKIYQLVGDYLKIHLETGNEVVYPFEVVSFAQTYQLELMPTISAIKLLAKDGLWEWNEDSQTRDIIQLTTGRKIIAYLEEHEPKLYSVLECLLRKYGSVYNFETAVSLREISKALEIDLKELNERIFKLQEKGVLRFIPAIYGGNLVWLHDRVLAKDLLLNIPLITNLRKRFVIRVTEMINFIENQTTCRNILLAKYFNQPLNEDCKKCDNCIKKYATYKSESAISEEILLCISKYKAINIDQLLLQFSQYERASITEIIRILLDEKKIILNNKRALEIKC